MMKPTGPLVVFVTAPTREEAQNIARALVEARKAACVSILPGVESHFWWDGKLQCAKEFLLIVKTRAELFPDVEILVKGNHSYAVPEIIGLPVTAGHAPYLDWIKDTVEAR